ncbi:GNAT family N-acetyltransferase [Kribbella sp. NPDC020789]
MKDLHGTSIRCFDAAEAAGKLDVVRELYIDVFFPPPHNKGPLELGRMVEAWPRRLAAPGFRLVVAEHDDGPVGCVYGHQLAATTAWWDGAVDPLPDGVAVERPGRTLAIIDMLVREQWRRRGLAEAMHDALLTARTEERVTLLVKPDNAPARGAYEKWGYRQVGRIQPFPDAAVFDSMVKPLI